MSEPLTIVVAQPLNADIRGRMRRLTRLAQRALGHTGGSAWRKLYSHMVNEWRRFAELVTQQNAYLIYDQLSGVARHAFGIAMQDGQLVALGI